MKGIKNYHSPCLLIGIHKKVSLTNYSAKRYNLVSVLRRKVKKKLSHAMKQHEREIFLVGTHSVIGWEMLFTNSTKWLCRASLTVFRLVLFRWPSTSLRLYSTAWILTGNFSVQIAHWRYHFWGCKLLSTKPEVHWKYNKPLQRAGRHRESRLTA